MHWCIQEEYISMERLLIKVSGTVQGVGFRPYVYWLAKSLELKGKVTNTSDGVTIDVEGENTTAFLERLKPEAPPLAQITNIDISPLPLFGYVDFGIIQSIDGSSFTLVSPDVSICDDCLEELRNPTDRRHGYPFINCTNCGPRYTITKRVPYDRADTTMVVFEMCTKCLREYNDPSDRRFHAQPNACHDCGPALAGHGPGYAGDKDPLTATVELLGKGEIVSIKGLGGFHIACDAANETAVRELRSRKRGNNKPFALMAPDMDTVRKYCHVSEKEEFLLESSKRPIVLLGRKDDCPLPEAIAPGNDRIGFMLPYTPLHYLIAEGFSGPLVMTSGNLSDEPIQADNAAAISKLCGIAENFLTHNRDIFMRVDDSVVKVTDRVFFIRRARGYAPRPIMVTKDGPDVLATGADIKNTFTLMKGPHAIVSQHIGDMENHDTLKFFEETLENLKSVYNASPEAIAHDLHPGYISTQWAMRQDVKKLGVQHHHAHIASVMAEKGLTGKVIGVAFDGTGLGTDGTLWGGEFLLAKPAGFKRIGHLKYVPLPGGERAVREPWRTAVSYVLDAVGMDEALEYLDRLGFTDRYGEKVADILKITGVKEVSPLSSGAGRLFDAVSAMLGICDLNTFEGEAAMALETCAADDVTESYPLDIRFKAPMEVDFTFTILGIVNDMVSGTDRGLISARFHNTVVEGVCRVVEKASYLNSIPDIVLSGGVFQNDYLLGRVTKRLTDGGLKVFTNELVPLNDGGISLGQAYVLRETLRMPKARDSKDDKTANGRTARADE
jgi:hydrogenase maturation protein HypF